MRAPLVLSFLAALGTFPAAQSLWTIDTAGTVTGQTGPAGGACSYPLGPLTAQWGYVTPGQCATPDVTPGAFGVGGIGMDRVDDELWITDGLTLASYATYSTPIKTGIDALAFTGAPLNGVDWDPAGLLWVTDGKTAVSATIQLNGVCWEPVVQTSFPLPIAPTATATALSHDPVTGALWVVDDSGVLTHVTKGGAVGALGSADVTATSGCTLAPSLTGVAVDTAGPGGRIYVTDGVTIAVVDMAAGGAAAAPTFYSPQSCFPAVTPLCDGLAVAASGNLFGSASGGFLPTIGAKGQSIVPNPSLAIEIGLANEFDVAVLVIGPDALCPSQTVLGVPFHIAPTPLVVAATVVIGDTGFASVPLPLGVGTPIGETVFMQWGVLTPSDGNVESSRGLAMTTSLP